MKNFLSILILFISFLSFSQVTIENGHVGDGGDFVFESVAALDENFTWKIIASDSTMNCFMQDGENLVDILVWNLANVEIGEEVTRYLVVSKDGVNYYLDFLNDGKSVIIFNTESFEYSIMEGAGVYYTLN
jgi:hypothetical protein